MTGWLAVGETADSDEEVEVEKIAPPPGVTVRDVELFKKVQQTTAEVLVFSFSVSFFSFYSI